jgi:sigma-B regulation protein RsbU (phosphoserine phosphatase)
MAQEREAVLRRQIAALEQRISHLEIIIRISQKLNTTLSLEPLLEVITRVAIELTDTEGCAILLLDPDTGELRFEVATAPNSQQIKGLSVPLDGSIAGSILLENKPLLIRNPREDPRFFKEVDEKTAFQTHSIIGVPLQVRGQAIGVLEAVNKRGNQEMSWGDVEVLAILADQAAVAIENARLYDDIRRMNEFNEDLVQRMAEGIVVMDAEGYITFVNPAATTLLGYASGELIGHHWSAIVTPAQHHIVEAAVERRARGETDRYELALVRKDGQHMPVLVSASPRFDTEARRYAGSTAVFTDITQLLAQQKIEQELALAWQIQASFLPDHLPDVPGWQLAATLEPARQTSGDFFDLIPLPNARLGLVVADVAGKGMGAALYMAVSRTLIRTYAVEFHAQPGLALRAANRRILMDTHTDLFVTAFYGILDPHTGTLTYCNAGHNPPYLFSAQNDGTMQALGRTGLPLGVLERTSWEQKTVQLAPGDLLLLYTDGITDAEDQTGKFFGQERLLEVAQANRDLSAPAIQDALLTEVHNFMGNMPQFDDIALIVLVRGLLDQPFDS